MFSAPWRNFKKCLRILMLQQYLFWVVMTVYVMDRQFIAPRVDLRYLSREDFRIRLSN